MIIAVIAMAVMQLPITEIVDMIAMGNLFMPRSLMVTGANHGRTGRWIHVANRDAMFIIVIAMQAVKMTLVKIIDMALMLNSQVAALLTMNMRMASMGLMLHDSFLSQQTSTIF